MPNTYTYEYNTTDHDPTVCTTEEHDLMLLFSIGAMNRSYEASVDAHTDGLKEIVGK